MKRIIVGISGASGVILGIYLLEKLKGKAEIHLIITDQAKEIIVSETDYEISEIENLADYTYNNSCMGASVASGSFITDGMVVLPCSIKSLSAIAMSYDENLLIRAADVTLKEKRKLVLCVREMPMHEGHLQLMATMAARGALICPPLMTFYNKPQSVMEMCNYVVGKIMDLMGFENDIFSRWTGKKEYINRIGNY